MFQSIISNFEIHTRRIHFTSAGTDPGLFLGGGALVSCSTSTSLNHIVFFFWQNTSCIRKPAGHLGGGGGGTRPLHPPPRSAPAQRLREFAYSCSTCLTTSTTRTLRNHRR